MDTSKDVRPVKESCRAGGFWWGMCLSLKCDMTQSYATINIGRAFCCFSLVPLPSHGLSIAILAWLQELFFDRFVKLLADNQRATFAGSMTSAWLSLRLQVQPK